MPRVRKIRPLFGSGWHIPDDLRVGTLAGLAGYDRRFREHIRACHRCRPRLLTLSRRLAANTTNTKLTKMTRSVTCVEARNAVMLYLEEGITPPERTLAHLTTCDACSRCFWPQD